MPVAPLAQPVISSSSTSNTSPKSLVRKHFSSAESEQLASSQTPDIIPSREIIQTSAPLNDQVPPTARFESRAATFVPPSAASTPKPTVALHWMTNPVTGFVYQSADGLSWQSVKIHGGTAFTSVANAGSTIWAGGKDGMLFRSADNGKTWEQVRPWGDASAGDVQTITFRDAQNGSVTTNSGKTYLTTDGGENWKQQ